MPKKTFLYRSRSRQPRAATNKKRKPKKAKAKAKAAASARKRGQQRTAWRRQQKGGKTEKKKSSRSLAPRKKTESTKSRSLAAKDDEQQQWHTATCGPAAEKERAGEYTCLSGDMLRKLAEAYNKQAGHAQIDVSPDIPPETLWRELQRAMWEKKCSDEQCWIKELHPTHAQEMRKMHAPYAPVQWLKNENEWLSSTDIEKVMKQYENDNDDFEFIGPSPINYADDSIYDKGKCVCQNLCKFSAKKTIEEKKKSKIGIIFNLDREKDKGSHWVSMFVDIQDKDVNVYYFDSTGRGPPPPVQELQHTFEKQFKDMHRNTHFHVSETPHQVHNTECGVYALYFITTMLKDTSMWEKQFSPKERKRIPDEEMTKFRYEFFNQARS